MNHDDQNTPTPDEVQKPNRERGVDAHGARKITKQALLFRDRYLPILIQGQYVMDYDRKTHRPTLGIPEPARGKKRPDIIDAYKAQEQINIQAGERTGLSREELASNENKAARIGLSTLFISEVFAEKRDALLLADSSNGNTGLRYEKSGFFGTKMVDVKDAELLSLQPKECLLKLKNAIAYTYQEAVHQVFAAHRKNPDSDMGKALKLYDHVLDELEPTPPRGGKKLTPELHVIRGLTTGVVEILDMVEQIADRMEKGFQKVSRELTVEDVAEVVNNSYDTIRKLAQLHIRTFNTEQRIFHKDRDESKPHDPRFFRLQKDDKGNLQLVLLEEVIKEEAGDLYDMLVNTDFKDGVTGCPVIIAESAGNANIMEEAFMVFVQKAIELYLPTRFPHRKQ